MAIPRPCPTWPRCGSSSLRDRTGMRGKITWFSEEREGGLLLGEDEVERYVDAEDVIGLTPLRSGDIVEFEHRDTSDGPRAVNVSFIGDDEESGRPSHGQVTCNVCHQTMVPTFVPDSVYPQLGHFACVYCGSTLKQRSPSRRCFIATAVYGDGNAEDLRILREFRDEVLLDFQLGRAFVAFYYRFSPPVASFLGRHRGARRCVRVVLTRAVPVCGLVTRFRQNVAPVFRHRP